MNAQKPINENGALSLLKAHNKQVRQQGWASIICNFFLFIVKYIAGVSSGSVALIADAWHTLADSSTSALLLFSAHFTEKPADREHPYGHGRFELIATLIIGVILGAIALEFAIDSVKKLQDGTPADYNTFAIVVTIVSVVVKELLAQYSFYVSRKTANKAVKADGWHHRSDSISSVVILAGIFISPYAWWVDGVLGLSVSAMLAWVTYSIIKSAVTELLGQKPSSKMIEQIKKICDEVSQTDVMPHDFHEHSYGRHIEMVFHIKLCGELSLFKSHDIATAIEKEIEKQLNVHPTIHFEPKKELPKKSGADLNKE